LIVIHYGYVPSNVSQDNILHNTYLWVHASPNWDWDPIMNKGSGTNIKLKSLFPFLRRSNQVCIY
jgi:hypothetical protein